MTGRALLLGSLSAVILLTLIGPALLGHWYLNLANIQLARAIARPNDAPSRVSILKDSTEWLNLADGLSKSPRVGLARARLALAENDPGSALEAFTQMAVPPDPIGHFVWAGAASQLGQADMAVAHWRLAGASVYFVQNAHRAAMRHDWPVAERFARVATAIEPNASYPHLVLANALSHLDVNDPEALRELERAADATKDPEMIATIYSRWGEIMLARGQLQDALEWFNRARQTAPIDARPRTGYAITALRIDPHTRTESIALLMQVVGDSPWYAAAYIALADIYQASGELHLAEKILGQGLDKNPKNPLMAFELGKLYARQIRYEEARTMFLLAAKHETRIDQKEKITRALAGLPLQ